MNGRYILDGHEVKPCDDLGSWALWLAETVHERQVGLHAIDGASISTCFLGLDHRFFGEGPPILFETKVFGGPLDGEQERYCTWVEAELGHERMVQRAIAAGKVLP